MDKTKIFNDSVYGQIALHPLLTKIISTKEFSRLRHLKQLGIVNYVYPCANNTRHEHSIGTCHLAGAFIQHLKQQHGDEYKINDVDVLCVQIAGLLHDIGHGPFSHLFEHVIRKVTDNHKWKHEEMSIKIIDKIYNNLKHDFNNSGIREIERDLIKDMIVFEGDTSDEKIKNLNDKWKDIYAKNGDSDWNKAFLFEIVSNHRNGIDVDKFDYFGRDSLYLGLKSNFQSSRYIMYSRIINVNGIPQICLRDIVASNLYEMYHIRSQLHRNAYRHKVCAAIELMIIDAFIKADKVFNFKEILQNVDQYCQLTDCIQEDIMNFKFKNNLYINALNNISIDFDNNLKEIFKNRFNDIEINLKDAQHILNRIENRRLYKFISHTIVLYNQNIDETEQNKIKNEIVEELYKLCNNNTHLIEDDIVIDVAKFNYGSGNRNPIDHVRFFNKTDTQKTFQLKSEQVSLMLPQTFQEIVLRLYCKKEECHDEKDANCCFILLNKAFINWIKLEKNKGKYSAPINIE